MMQKRKTQPIFILFGKKKKVNKLIPRGDEALLNHQHPSISNVAKQHQAANTSLKAGERILGSAAGFGQSSGCHIQMETAPSPQHSHPEQ